MGAVTLRTALALSRNVVAVKLAERIGLDKVIDYAHRMGVTAELEPNLSLALGSSVVSPLDQASGYSTLANQGLHVDPTPFRLVKDSLGSVVLDNQYAQANDVVGPGTAFLMTSMLEDVINKGTGYPNAIIGRPAAGKTGTTSDFRDAWFVGYTPDLVTAVWLGNDDYSRMYESYGGNIPARIWARFMKAALAGTPPHDFPVSDEVTRIASCRGGYEYYLKGTEPVNCGHAYAAGIGDYNAEPAVDLPPAPTAAPTDSLPPQNSVGDGEHSMPLGSAAPAETLSPQTPASAAPPAANPVVAPPIATPGAAATSQAQAPPHRHRKP
jgi:penicillin-binding protein 1A